MAGNRKNTTGINRRARRHYSGLITLGLATVLGTAPGAVAADDAASDPAHIDSYQPHPRVFILSDIGNEPDDQMSLTRLLLYANEMRIEGLVATTSCWQRTSVRPDMMQLVLSHYAQVQPNLLKHDPAYPSAQTLGALIKAGQSGFGMAATGPDKMSDGATLLVKAIEKQDAQPLHVLLWGGANTLAEALQILRHTYDAATASKLVSRLRVYSISDQDDAGPWIRREFPELPYIVDPSRPDGESYSAATWTGISGDLNYRNGDGADFTTVSNSWLDTHIRSKGPMGKSYLHYAFIMEGDTPTFLGLTDNGLDSAMNPGWGGWGGRYIVRQPLSETRPIWTNGGDFFPGKPNGADTVTGVDGKPHTSPQATIWRWRAAYQHDFESRMDWTIQDVAHANHPPKVVVQGDHTTAPVFLTLHVGQSATLDSKGTADPDHDRMQVRWFIYREASLATSSAIAPADVVGRRGEDRLNAPLVAELDGDGPKATLHALRPGTAHVILEVEDSGTPSLTRYRRVVATITP